MYQLLGDSPRKLTLILTFFIGEIVWMMLILESL
nr:MAG TPA: hypothetical protein [Caudoviricetes sp.]